MRRQSGSGGGTPISKPLENVNSFQQYIPNNLGSAHSSGTVSAYGPPDDGYGFPGEVEGLPYEMDESNVSESPDFISSMSHQPSDRRVVNPNSQRFEAFVEDHLGSFAPTFMSHRPSQPEEPFSLGDPSSDVPIRFDVDLGTRSTLDIERQFINLDSEDMDYLRAKGNLCLCVR